MEIRKRFKVYWPFSISVIQTLLSYRVNFFIFVAGGILQTFVIYYLWRAVFYSSGQETLEGFTIGTMLIYIFMSEITSRIVQSDVDRAIGDEVKQGTIAMNLIRPISYHIRLLFMAIGGNLYQFIFICLPIWVGVESYRYFSLGGGLPDLRVFFFYFLSISLSFIILFLFNLCFGLMAFFVTNMWGFSRLKGVIIAFFSGQIIPLVFFPEALQRILNFFPFASMNYIPVMIYLNKIEGNEMFRALGVQFFWVIILGIISTLIWNKAISRLTILGG
ncbi:ABC transporter permease [Halonatronum saccharophilum]|uniref:ABC transporter permease n=1 Tax=Halonatronum saccharophilum TaxID=150060 RepID=UPI0004BCD97E|nr:ABC-2 family transporter protein [Halonatronum saccharophilum]